jgi:hypothetical protein
MVPRRASTVHRRGITAMGKTSGGEQRRVPMYIGVGAVIAIILIIILLAWVF